ncbi:MAG: hypothetical protein M1812_005046 [Candelaria pacifica]|nr:MAG: hypothetical protein M1812_005046 [Candelaria pacifica]
MDTRLSNTGTNPPTRKATSFLDLPAELRIEIYKLHLLFSDKLSLILKSKDAISRSVQYTYSTGTGPEIFVNNLDICLVSKQVCQETLPIFYHDNRFYFASDQHSDVPFINFLHGIGQFRRSLISSFELRAQIDGPEWAVVAFAHLRDMQQPSTLILRVSHWKPTGYSFEVPKVLVINEHCFRHQIWDEDIVTQGPFLRWLSDITVTYDIHIDLYWSQEPTDVVDPEQCVSVQLRLHNN